MQSITFAHDVAFDALDCFPKPFHPTRNLFGEPFSPLFSRHISFLSLLSVF
jgi:hypothetical protein